MTQILMEKLDTREAAQLVAELLVRRLGYVPEWAPSEQGPDAALAQVAATYWQTIIQRLNQAPQKNKLAFFDTVGIQLIRAQAARTPLVFRLADNANDARLPAGTRVAAPPPPERNDQIIFETESATGIAAAKLQEVVSLWPGRDQYIDHSAAYLAGQAIQPFNLKLLQDTPHYLYIAHDTLLALAGKSRADVIFELTTLSNEHLDIIWEYWNGKLWRQFKDMQPECDQQEAGKLDTTDGLQFSGAFILETDCAETSKTTVNGIEGFWIRGRLNEPLPASANRMLPEVESIKLGTSIANPLSFSWNSRLRLIQTDTAHIFVKVTDDTGSPLRGIHITSAAALVPAGPVTDVNGRADFRVGPKVISVLVGDSKASAIIPPLPEIVEDGTQQEVDFTLTVSGLRPDKSFADASAVDLTKPFLPFGPQPQPGSTFYFSSQEVLSKPGAKLDIYIQTAPSAQDQLSPQSPREAPDKSTTLSHTVSWEYWDGKEWAALIAYTNDPPDVPAPTDFSGTGIIAQLPVPSDLVETEVNGQKGLWMRVRLVAGGYGFINTISSGAEFENEFRFPVLQPPTIAKILIGYTWQHGPYYAEHVLAFNDFQFEDRTAEAQLPGQTFLPFKPVSDRTPTLYLGFDKKLPVDRLGILFDILEQRDDTSGPALLWQYFDGILWEDLIVDDETRYLRLPGLVSLIGPEDSAFVVRFGTARHWLRARLKEDGPPGEPTFNGLYPNAVHAIQHQTIVDEPMGASTGQPNQTFAFTQIPVLEDERIEVREVAGLRANVEWRIITLDVFAGDLAAVRELDAMIASSTQTEIIKGDVRLTRDRNKRVTEVWVRWQSRRSLAFSGGGDRDYVVDRAQGLLLFGDATNGKVPPAGAAILARQYLTGGGNAGNVAAKKISQILAPAGGIEQVFNPLPAEGGADGESMTQYEIRAPQTLRHRGRALLPGDYETFAREASPAVAFARAISGQDPSGQQVPGWVTLLIIPQSGDPRPFPSFGLREEVRQHIEECTSADLAAAHRIYVTGPDYFPIDVDAIVVPLDPAEAGFVEQLALDALQTFFHPLHGGPDGSGWDLGRDVFLSDIASVLERVEGVDYVKDLRLLVNSELQGERVKVADEQIVVAGQFRISLVEA